MEYFRIIGEKGYHRNYKVLTLLITVIMFVTGTIIYMNVEHTVSTHVKVSLVGSESQQLSINSNYVEEGVVVTINEKEVDIKD